MNIDSRFFRRLFLKRSGATALGWAAFVGLEPAPA
jgi:hypothetical protein